MTHREFMAKVNELAKTNIDRAQGWVDCYNRDTGSNCYILNRRVVFDRMSHGVITVHDAYTWASTAKIF